MSTTGHENEAINVQGLKASLQKFKTDHVDGKAAKATTLQGYGITDAYTKNETYTKTEVNGLVSTPHQEYVTVATYASLPASGSADTIYRVSSYDGANSQVDDTVYSEYAWDGTQYVFLDVKSQIDEVFDITVYNSNTKYANLSAALGVDGANIPQSLRRGGMSIKYVQSSDNKYVQARCMAQNFTTDVTQWQGVDDKPTAGSDNLVKSGGVHAKIEAFEEDKFIINTTIGAFYYDSPTWFTDLRYQANRCVSKGYKACNISLLIPDGYLASPIYGDKNGAATWGDYKSGILEISSDMLYFRIVVKKTDNSDLSEAIILRIFSNIAKINAKISTIEDDVKDNEYYLNEINKSYVHKSIPLFANISFNWDANNWFTQKIENNLRASTKGFKYIQDSLLVSPDNIAITIINGNKDEALSNPDIDYTGKCSLLTKGNAYPFFRIIAKKIDGSEVTDDDLFNGIEVIPLEEYICKKKVYWTQGGYDYETFKPVIYAPNLASSTPIIGNCMIKLKDGYKIYYVYECDGFAITKHITDDITSYNDANNIIYTGGKNIIISVGDINRSEEVPLDGSVIEEIIYLKDAQKSYSLYNNQKDMMSIMSDGWTLDGNGHLKNNSSANKLILDREYAINPRKIIFNFVLAGGIAYFGTYPSKYRLQPRTRTLFSVDLNLGKFSVYKIFQDNSGNVDDITDVYQQVDIPNFESYSNKDMQIELYHNFGDYYANLIDGVTGEILCSLTGLSSTTVGYMFERPYCYSPNNLTIKNITINTSPIHNCHLMIFGDSITEGAGATNFGKSYAGLISNEIGNDIVRISGRSSGIIDNVIERIRAEAVYLKPKYIMVTIGTNGSNTESKLKELIELIKSINAIPIINHIPMVVYYNYTISTNNMIDNVLNWYKEKGEIIRCAKYDIVTAINNIPSQGQNGELFVDDNVHPNNTGHNLMFLRTKIDIPELF